MPSACGGRRLSDDEFRERVREVKERHRLSDIIGRATNLKRVGREMVGRCFMPGHEDSTPSLSVNDDLGVWYCRGCGETGDSITAVEIIQKTDFNGAVRWLGGLDLPRFDPTQRLAAVRRDEHERGIRADDAEEIWRNAGDIDGSLGEIYLRSRGISWWPPTMRFARTWWWRNYETGECSASLPAVIGRVDRADGFSGIQRIFLRADGQGKAAIGKGKAKLSLGGVRGGALRLAPAAPTIHVTEGPEDGLSLMQERPGICVWVALGAANMSRIRYPEGTVRVVICAQNDAAADRATEEAAVVLIEEGYLVEVRRPRPEFKDWNDQLRGITMAAPGMNA